MYETSNPEQPESQSRGATYKLKSLFWMIMCSTLHGLIPKTPQQQSRSAPPQHSPSAPQLLSGTNAEPIQCWLLMTVNLQPPTL